MQFINPLELLNLPADGPAADPAALRKARRRLQAEIELNDGSIDVHGRSYTWSDLEPHLAKLDDRASIHAYAYVSRHPDLSNFLTKGDLSTLAHRDSQSGIPPDVLQVISPFAAYQYNRLGERMFKAGDAARLGDLFRGELLVIPADRDAAFIGVTRLLRTAEAEIDRIASALNADTATYTASNGLQLVREIRALADYRVANALPAYFQKQRNAIAYGIRNVSVAIWNKCSLGDIAEMLLAYALQFYSDGHTAEKLREDHKQIRAMAEREKEEALQRVNLEHAIAFVAEGVEKMKLLKAGALTPAAANAWVAMNLKADLINDLAPTYQELRDQVALVLRAISVEVWNASSDLEHALALVRYAKSIHGVSESARLNIREAEQDLAEIGQQRLVKGTRRLAGPQAPQQPAEHSTATSSSARTGTASTTEKNPGSIVAILGIILIGIGYATELGWLGAIGLLAIVVGIKSNK